LRGQNCDPKSNSKKLPMTTTQTLSFNNRLYQLSDLSEDARQVVAAMRENQMLTSQHLAYQKQLGISHEALRANLEIMLRDVNSEPADEASQSAPATVTEGWTKGVG
jgi:predicted HTH transcriptional regulator